MNRPQLCSGIAENRCNIRRELPGNIFDRRHLIQEATVILIKKFMVVTAVDHRTSSRFDLADVYEHSSRGINLAGKRKPGGVISSRPVTRVRLGSEDLSIILG